MSSDGAKKRRAGADKARLDKLLNAHDLYHSLTGNEKRQRAIAALNAADNFLVDIALLISDAVRLLERSEESTGRKKRGK